MSSGSSNVDIRLTADERDAVLAWQRVRREGPEGLDAAMEKLGHTSQKTHATMAEQLESTIMRYGKLAVILGTVKAAIQAVAAAEEERRQKGADSAVSLDESLKKFQVQTGLRDADAGSFRERILDAAQRNAVTNQQAAAAATQLASSGMSADMASGQGLDVALQIMSATNAAGRDVDPAQLIRAISQFNKGTGRGFDARGLAATGVEVQRLFKGTDIQIGDLESLSKHAASLKMQGGLGASEQLATFSYLRDILGADIGATAFSQTVTELSTAGADKKKVGLLRKLGLKPEDVDLKGEGLETAFSRLRGGMAGMSESQRAIMTAGLFGKESMRGASTMLDPSMWPEVARRRALMGDAAGFALDLDIAGSGPAARERRSLASQERKSARPEDQRQRAIERELDEIIDEDNWFVRNVKKFQKWSAMKVGLSPEFVDRNIEGAMFPEGAGASKAVDAMSRNSRSIDENTAVLKQLLNESQQGANAKAPAAAAIGGNN